MIDLNPGEITELESHLNFWKWHYTFCWIASLQPSPDATGPTPPWHQDEDQVGQCSKTLRSRRCSLGREVPSHHAEFLTQGYQPPAFQQHHIHLQNWSKFILISFYVTFPGLQTGRHRKPRQSSDHHPRSQLLLLYNRSLISRLHLREGSLSVSHLFLLLFSS